MRKLSILSVMALVAVGFIASPAKAATTASFNITITLEFLELVLKANNDSDSYAGPWALGVQATSVSVTNAGSAAVVANIGTTTVGVDIKCKSVAASTPWTLGASAGADQYAIAAKGFGATQAAPDMSDASQLTGSDNIIMGGTNKTASTWLYFKFDTPSETSTGAAQTNTVTVTIARTS